MEKRARALVRIYAFSSSQLIPLLSTPNFSPKTKGARGDDAVCHVKRMKSVSLTKLLHNIDTALNRRMKLISFNRLPSLVRYLETSDLVRPRGREKSVDPNKVFLQAAHKICCYTSRR